MGTAFLTAVDIAITELGRWPDAGVALESLTIDPPLRRVPVRRFPYHVVYLLTDHAVRILAVAHDRRRPDYWQHRISP